jgi:hypothetical protein
VSLPFDVDGPIGHTFDTDAESPLYGSATYVVSPPDVPPIDGDLGLGGYFAKLRFRRLLLPEGTADPDVPFLPGDGQKWAEFDDDWVLLVAATVKAGALVTVTLFDNSAAFLCMAKVTRLSEAVEFSFDRPPAQVKVPLEGTGETPVEVVLWP